MDPPPSWSTHPTPGIAPSPYVSVSGSWQNRLMEPAQFAALLTPTGWDVLAGLPPYPDLDVLRTSSALRKDGHSPQLISAALTQARLRHLATDKFGPFASTMLFTEVGLEQSSRLAVAALHAGRFRDAGVTSVVDLCCGLGGDAMAMAALGLNVTAVDSDEVTAGAATMNLGTFDHARVVHADATTVTVPPEAGVFFDPSRRTGGKKVVDPSEYSPSWDFVLDTCRAAPAAGIKVAPGIDHDHLPEDAEAQWVSHQGTVVEVGLWFGLARRDGVSRSALVATENGNWTIDSPERHMRYAEAGPLGEYVWEPDGAVIRSHLIAELADQLSAHLLEPRIAYLTGDTPTMTPGARCYQVLDTMPYSIKNLQRCVEQLDATSVAIKKRGVDIIPEEVRKKLNLRSVKDHKPHEATFIVTTMNGKRTALHVVPIVDEG